MSLSEIIIRVSVGLFIVAWVVILEEVANPNRTFKYEEGDPRNDG